MGRLIQCSIVTLLRKNPRWYSQISKTQIRNLSVEVKDCECNGGEVVESKSCGFEGVVKDVSRFMRLKPRWEESIVSDFPDVNFTDAMLVHELFKSQKNVFLSLRFLSWLRLNFDFVPDEGVCNELFDLLLESKACGGVKHFLEISGFVPELSSLERYVCCLCDGGFVQDAIEVFTRIRETGRCPSIKTWNSVLLCCVKVRRTDVVWRLYQELMGSEIAGDIDLNTVQCLIQAFTIDGRVTEGYELLRQILGDGVLPRNVTFNKLIAGLSKGGRFNSVSELIHTMIVVNRRPDIITYQEVINGLCKRRNLSEALRIFNDLKARGYAPDRCMYTTMIHGFCSMGRVADASSLWFEMINKGIVPNEWAYNAYILGFCKIGNFEEVTRLRKEMRDRGLSEDRITYNTLMHWLVLHERVNEASNLFNEMLEKGIVRDSLSYNSLILGFCKEGKVTESRALLKELLSHNIQPMFLSYAPLIEKLCTLGEVQEAEKLWNDMQSRGLKPRAYIYDYLITAFCDKGHSQKGMNVLSGMLNNKLQPQKTTVENLIHHLIQNDKLDDSLRVSEILFGLGHTLENSICHSLVTRLCKEDSLFMDSLLCKIIESN